MDKKITSIPVENILDFLQKQSPYRFRLDVNLIPSVLREPFYKAVEEFKEIEKLKILDRSKMGICEEVADLAYQVLKMTCLVNNILTPNTITTLQDYLKSDSYYDADGSLVGLDYVMLDKLSIDLVSDDLVLKTRQLLPKETFLSCGDNGHTIIRNFLSGQFVAYISRQWRNHKAGGLQNIEYLKTEKIPEETWELVDALVKSSENLSGENLMQDTVLNLDLSNKLISLVETTRSTGCAKGLFIHLDKILKLKMVKSITIEDTLWLMFLKMKGRQEMDFSGIDEKTIRLVCKPVEYLIEANMFF